MRTVLQDLRYACRNLLHARGFTAIAALTLAVGIGANSAIFSIIDTILIRPLPFPEPRQLVRLYETESEPGEYPFAGPDFVDWKAQNHTFQDMALYRRPRSFNLSGSGQPEFVRCVNASANFFSVLGARPLLGRTFAAGEDQPGRNHVAVLSYALWQSRYAGDRSVLGTTLELNSEKYAVVGVMPASFRYPAQAQLWTPMELDSKGLGVRGNHWGQAIGRMKPGVELSTAEADLKLIAARLERQFPRSNYKVGAKVVALHDDLAGRSRKSLFTMLSAVVLVLLIACTNVANLLLSRAAVRQKEMAIRTALGAPRSRLLRQLLTESALLSLIGGGLGLLLAWGLISVVPRLEALPLPRFNLFQLNGSVLAFTFAVAVGSSLLFGMFPALHSSRPDHGELKGGAGSSISPSRGRRRASNALVVFEIALSLVLLISAGLLLRDFARMRRLDIGVQSEGVWTTQIRLPQVTYKTAEQKAAFAARLLEELQRIPGVESAALTSKLPLEGGSNYYIHVRGRTFQPMSGPLVEEHAVTPDYFSVMGIRLLKGRNLTEADAKNLASVYARILPMWESGRRIAPEVTEPMLVSAVINEAMARRFWPGEDALGKVYSHGSEHGPWTQVVGIVSDVRGRGLTVPPVPEAYDPFTSDEQLIIALRGRDRLESLAGQVRAVVARLDPSLALIRARTMREVIDEHAEGQQFLSFLVGSFAGIAALLAAIGIYGVLSYAVTQRTREIGIRISLGASRGQILGNVLSQGMKLAAIGFVLGLIGAFAAGRVLASLLNEVEPTDPATFMATAALLAAVALLACYLPARRAARLNPVNALRYD